MPIVDAGDGYEIDFPDTMSGDEINAAMRKTLKWQDPKPAAPVASRNRRADMVGRAARSVYSSVLGVGQGFLGVGDYAGMLGQLANQAVTGKTLSAHEAFKTARENRELIAAENPTNYAIGFGGGALATGGAIARGAPSLALKGAPILRNVAGYAVKGKASVAANIGRLMGTGALAGGLQTGLEGSGDASETLTGAATGAVLAPAAAGVVKGVAHVMEPAVIKAAKVLSKITGETPEMLARAITKFKADTGRPARAQDIMDLKQSGRLREYAGANPDLAAATISANEASAVERASATAAKTSSGGPVKATAELQTALDDQGDIDFAAVRGKTISLSADDARFILDDALPAVPMTRTAREAIHAAVTDRSELSGGDFDLIRRKLGALARAKPGEGAYELREELMKRGGAQLSEIKTATQNYAKGAQRVSGAELGEKALAETDTRGFVETVRKLTAEGREGLEASTRNLLTSMAERGPDAAETFVQNLAANPGLSARLRAVLGDKHVDELLTAAKAEASAIASSNRATVMPRDSKGTGLMARGAQAAAGAGALVRGALPSAGYHFAEATKSVGAKLRPKVVAILSDWVKDPSQAGRAAAAMRAIGLRDRAVQEIMRRAAASTGIVTGAAYSATKQ